MVFNYITIKDWLAISIISLTKKEEKQFCRPFGVKTLSEFKNLNFSFLQ